MRIAFQGTLGAYSEVALYKHFGKDVKACGRDLSEEVFASVTAGEVEMGILPVENSIVGNVSVNLDLFSEHDVYVTGEVYIPIKHCLLAVPGSKLDNIIKVYSHPIALDQCRDFLNKQGMQAISEYDTAGAAKCLMKKRCTSSATIASSLCADYYGLEILSENIQKVRRNITRFFVFVDRQKVPDNIKEEKVSLVFAAHHHPGALLGCLQKFADHGINLTKLESRPIPENPFEYIFFVDFLGSLMDKNVSTCLEDLRVDARKIKIIGSYPKGEVA